MKARIMPEDININISKNAPVPKCEMAGHNWKSIVHDNRVIKVYEGNMVGLLQR